MWGFVFVLPVFTARATILCREETCRWHVLGRKKAPVFRLRLCVGVTDLSRVGQRIVAPSVTVQWTVTGAKKPRLFSRGRVLALPIFPGSRPPSIVGANELNFCVRDGNRWTLTAINTNSYRWGLTHLLYLHPVGRFCRLAKFAAPAGAYSTTHLAVVWLAFAPSKLTQLGVSSFICNLFSPSAVSPLQMTTSAHPFPFSPRSPLRFLRFLRFLPFFWAFGPGFPLPPLSSPSVRFPFVPLTSGSGYSASCSSFQPSIGSASQWLSQRPDPFFRPDQIFLFLTDWFPVRYLRFCLFSSPVCSLSLFPASLPQPFHRCSGILRFLQLLFPVRPCVRSLQFHPASFPPLSFPFAPVRLGLRYLVSASSFPCFKLPPHSGFHSAATRSVPLRFLRFHSLVPPVAFFRPLRLPTSFPLSVLFRGSFSSFAPLPAVPFRFLWSVSLRIWYSVLLLFFSPLQVSPHSCYFLSPAFPLGFRPSP